MQKRKAVVTMVFLPASDTGSQTRASAVRGGPIPATYLLVGRLCAGHLPSSGPFQRLLASPL